MEWSESLCQAMVQAGPGSQRAVMRDHGMTEAYLDEVFKSADEDDMYEFVASVDTEECSHFLMASWVVWQRKNSKFEGGGAAGRQTSRNYGLLGQPH